MTDLPPPNARRVLIVEDEPSIADTLVYALRTEGFDAVHCLTGRAASAEVARQVPDIVLLDVGLPDTNGFEWCKQLRREHTVPVVFLTARSDEIDRVVGLEIGGDDYVTKPFSPRELTARVRAILRRGPARPEVMPGSQSAAPTVRVDEESCMAWYHGTALQLTRYEFRLLAALSRRPGRVFSRDALMAAGWEDPAASTDRTVDAHIKTLRAKLRAVQATDTPICTHRGMGYSWKVTP
ncbi:two-component system response regulator CreB [Synoicihabitans lomoniglobus]|uniref:Two-component system response regulator CreB n=1 Tax=Synoicihabitans lomoniglobus TaxID=2909285 RepID=A0AAF0CH80_9BACT|nr:two-component system response regulator CreB [Opitutaceae bacterium LMO-M01]WED63977.1 two-component system response regulator CreB [Opitutaceae bacterium LMO-M01]